VIAPGNIFRLFQLYAVKGSTKMNKFLLWLVNPPTDGPKSTLLLRLMAGGVFFWEGLLKFVYVNQGVGRFTKLGIPFPHFTAAFIGYLEIVGGLLLLTGLMTRLIAIPFIGEMIVAILSTKISLYLGTSPLPLPPALPQVGFWAVLHEIRSDSAQILTVIFLLINGPGKWSLDAVLLRKWRTDRVSRRVQSGRSLDLSAAAHS
jgi:putative oxidoreductase